MSTIDKCKDCPAFGKCEVTYRGSACAALRRSYGVDYDPEIKRTNADAIRNMSDEELAEFLRWDICVKIRGDNRLCDGMCDRCVIEWLKQPIKGENDA